MDITNEAKKLIGQAKSATLEYKAVLPPSRIMAQIIGSFANAEGGYLILGIAEGKNGSIEVNGLSEDFHASTITHKALDILKPQPKVSYQYISFNDKKLYVIKVEKSDSPVAIEGKVYKRVGAEVELTNPVEITFKAQLQLDLAEGESWHTEFKEYDHRLLDEKIADSWKNDLSDELAAFGSIGGKIYIGISDTGTITGVGGSHQTWQEKLLERALGRVKPKVKWQSYYFTDPTTGLSLIRIDVLEDEPIYYVQGKPYLRDGTKSRPAEPEEVKARFKEYFTNREPILPAELGHSKSNDEQSALIS